jgi:hypothetical protein
MAATGRIAIAAVAAAVAGWLLWRALAWEHEAQPSVSAPQDRPQPAAATASATAQPDDDRRAVVAADTEPLASVTDAGNSRLVVVRVVDSAGAPMTKATVELRGGNRHANGDTDSDGIATFADTRRLGDGELVCNTSMLGRYLQTVVPQFAGVARRIEVSMGDTGFLSVRVLGDPGDARAQIQATNSIGGVQMPLGAEPVRILVPTGADLLVFPTSRLGTSPLHVVGPRRPHEVVEVELDFCRCQVAGRLAPAVVGATAILVNADEVTSVPCELDGDGAFRLALPQQRSPAQLVIVTDDLATECRGARLDRATCDVGTVALQPRPLLGMLSLGNPATRVDAAPPRSQALQFAFRDVGAVRSGLSTGKLAVKRALGPGMEEWFGVPGLDVVEVTGRQPGYCSEPTSVMLRVGGHATIHMLRAGAATVLLDAGDTQGLVDVWLQPAGGGTRIDRQRGTVNAEGQFHRFGDLLPGHYTVETSAGRPVGGELVVTSGSDQELHLVLPRR